MMKQEYRSIKGEEIPIMLEKINTYLDKGDVRTAELFLEIVREELPDTPDIVVETKKRLDEVHLWYNEACKPFKVVINSNKYLEKPDAQQELFNLRVLRAYREWKIYRRIVSMFKIAEDNSIVDYEL